ncbi:alpha-E domain-containing protein [Brevibacterium litoralis]|uniref:alpha-E domain-containing protein n=1 Tax=Brevibacterium litoralis TaxID=3138935 RepID=UPI0032ECEFBD
MLSRIAESLFWIGRYIERADGTARILDVHSQLMLEDPWIDEDAACRSLLTVMGAAVPVDKDSLTRSEVLWLLSVDRDTPSSIAFSIRQARENARRAREIVSSELWEVLNNTYRRMPNRLRSTNVHDAFEWVSERTALAYGVIDNLVARDESWQFLALGRTIERTDMTARLLATRTLTHVSGPSWTTILRSCGAYEPFLRAYQGAAHPSAAAEFLLLDRLFPRSITFSIAEAERCMRAIEPTSGRIGSPGAVLRALGRVRHELEYTPITELVADLPQHMETVQKATLEASDAIRQRFFPTQSEPTWIGEVG